MQHLGDYLPGDTVEHKFNTRSVLQEAITLAGTPSVAVYKDHGTTEDTSGVTLVVDFDSKTGLHCVYIDTSSDLTFYSLGGQFSAVLAAGTIDGIDHANVKLFSFSIGRSLDAMGISGVGLLSGTHSTVTGDLGANAPTTDISGQTLYFPAHKIARAVSSYNTSTGVATFDAVGVTLADGNRWLLFPTAPDSGGSGLDAAGVRTAIGLAAPNLDTQLSGIQSDTNALQTGVDDLPTNAELATALAAADDAVLARLGTPAGASIAADIAAAKSDTGAIKTKTDQLTFGAANTVNANVTYVNEIAVDGSGTTLDPWGPV